MEDYNLQIQTRSISGVSSDADGDGISGVASYVDSATLGGRALGRFGLKANVATVADQAANAFLSS